MLIKEAKKIIGGLSHTSKMPCPSWSTPPSACHMGNLYSTYKNSVCSDCYAKKGFSRFSIVQRARERRLANWKKNRIGWTSAMIVLIQKHSFFRWFDAGDIYNENMFKDICTVCKCTPDTKHWLPTLERKMVLNNTQLIPNNLCVRFSSPIINQQSSSYTFPISMVTTGTATCLATLTKGQCDTCRDCWDKKIPLIKYKKH